MWLACAPLYAQQAHVNLDWNPHKNHDNLTPFMANSISPEVRDDHNITFRIKAPKAQEVQLAPGPLLLALGKGNVPLPFSKADDGTWSLTVGPVKPNIYVYKFIIDGAMVPDPNNTLGGVGDQPPYSQLVVHGNGPAYYDAQKVPHGAVTRHVYSSDVTKGEREKLLPGERVARRVERENVARWAHGHVTGWPGWRWKLNNAAEALQLQLRVHSLDGFGLRGKPLAVRAAGAIIQYIHETQRNAASLARFSACANLCRFHWPYQCVLSAVSEIGATSVFHRLARPSFIHVTFVMALYRMYGPLF